MKLLIKLTEGDSAFPVTFINDDETLEVKFESLQILKIDESDYYEGDTFLIPNFMGRILNTTEKKMRTNVVMAAIPVQSVSNPQGGMTVTIGSI